MTKNTLPDQLTCCLSPGTEHEQKSSAHEWIKRTLKNCDVPEVASDYKVSIKSNIATFKRGK